MKRHHPYHIYKDDAFYFLTARTYNKSHYLDTDKKKQLLLDKIRQTLFDFHYWLYAWVILSNHYHVEFKTRIGKDLPKIMGKIHGRNSYDLNQLDHVRGRKVWQNYWDYCIRNERDFWIHFNYIHYNPVKHGYVESMEDYRFSSYQYYINKRGEDWLLSCFREYPIINFGVDGDSF